MKLTEKEFEKIENPSCDLTNEDYKEKLLTSYKNILDLLRKYCDLKEEDYSLVATWIIGTYFHDKFKSYPYLFLNAMKGSGKTRTLKLITSLSKDGEVILNPTEAVIFRTKSTLGIDEAEGFSRKGKENLIELLNGCYKSGSKVKRMKQKKTEQGTEQVVEEFDIYRPLVLANINGMDEVLGDRCITIILERSKNKGIVKLVESWEDEFLFVETLELLKSCTSCSVHALQLVYSEWNNYIVDKYINTIQHTTYTTYTNYTYLFNTLDSLDLTGREIELTLPLIVLSWEISQETFKELFESIKSYGKNRKEEQFNESLDISIIDFVSQEISNDWKSLKEITLNFREFIQSEDPEVNPKWMGIALKRLNLKKETRRKSRGVYIILDTEKAQDKIKMFK